MKIPECVRNYHDFKDIKAIYDMIYEVYQSVNVDKYDFRFNIYGDRTFHSSIRFSSNSYNGFYTIIQYAKDGNKHIIKDASHVAIYDILPENIIETLKLETYQIRRILDAYSIYSIFDDEINNTADKLRNQIGGILNRSDILLEHDRLFQEHVTSSLINDLYAYKNIPLDMFMNSINTFVIRNIHEV